MKTLILAVVLSGLTIVNSAFAYAPSGISMAERLQLTEERSFSLIETNPLIARPAADIAAVLWREGRLVGDTLHDACVDVVDQPMYREDSYWFCLNYLRQIRQAEGVTAVVASPAE